MNLLEASKVSLVLPPSQLFSNTEKRRKKERSTREERPTSLVSDPGSTEKLRIVSCIAEFCSVFEAFFGSTAQTGADLHCVHRVFLPWNLDLQVTASQNLPAESSEGEEFGAARKRAMLSPTRSDATSRSKRLITESVPIWFFANAQAFNARRMNEVGRRPQCSGTSTSKAKGVSMLAISAGSMEAGPAEFLQMACVRFIASPPLRSPIVLCTC